MKIWQSMDENQQQFKNVMKRKQYKAEMKMFNTKCKQRKTKYIKDI